VTENISLASIDFYQPYIFDMFETYSVFMSIYQYFEHRSKNHPIQEKSIIGRRKIRCSRRAYVEEFIQQ